MAQQPKVSVENNFTKGLITEFTGLNFPENAATDMDNTDINLVGDVERRLGIDYETNYNINPISTLTSGVVTYKWNNAGGDGGTQLLVAYTGGFLYFWNISAASESSPLSAHRLGSIINMSAYAAVGSVFSRDNECQFSDGNGYLFVTHPNCEPIYCTYTAGGISANNIYVQTRDFVGDLDNIAVNLRPAGLAPEHSYNLQNQGWVTGNPWQTTSSSGNLVNLGPITFVVSAGLPIVLGDTVQITSIGLTTDIPYGTPVMSGTVTAYAGVNLTMNIYSINTPFAGHGANAWILAPYAANTIATWFTQVGNYPSNADVWWYFKDSTGTFSPGTTVANTVISQSAAPKGHFILNEFNQQRGTLSGLAITPVTTVNRPRTTTWFQGRVWFAGVDAQQPATGNVPTYSWTENIYFSQVVNTPADFGRCYQNNDPTSENLFDLLPTDGGVIHIQGCGSIYKLFPISNGMLVFAANGIWFITGSQGIGFTANDYTITKISSVQSISGTSFVDVFGLPYFWNEEGIYSVTPGQGPNGQLQVEAITLGTILGFYNDIPLQSKKFAKAAFNPIEYTIQWLYRDTNETGISDRYVYNRILNFDTYNKAFYPYTLSAGPHVSSINYVAGPGGSGTENPGFKYFTITDTGITFSEIADDDYVDWASTTPTEYESFFVTGYRVHGQAQNKFQMPYILTFSNNEVPTSFRIQGLWDYATSGNSGRWSTAQLVNNFSPNFGILYRRHRIRGQGLALQIKVTSVDNMPFHLIGWSTFDTVNQGL